MIVRGNGLRRLIRAGVFGVWLPAIALAGTPSFALAETRGFAISMIHTATYGDTDTCPVGMNGGPTEIKQGRLMAQGYSAEDALRIIANDGKDEDGNTVEIQAPAVYDGISTNPANLPSLVPDPGVKMAEGRFALGFNLDGEVEPDSFEHPESGERGIDNQMWRVLGCYDVYTIRRPVRPYNEDIAWDTALDSMPAWLMSVTGEDLDNDGEVTVTFDRGLNVAMRDTHGGLLPGATYVVDPDPLTQRVQRPYRGRNPDDRARGGLRDTGRVPVLCRSPLHERATAPEDGSRRQWERDHRWLPAVEGLLPLPGDSWRGDCAGRPARGVLRHAAGGRRCA